MKGLIFNIQKYSIHDGPGIRTIVFLKGCFLSCRWCSNPESQSFNTQVLFKKQICKECNICITNCPEKAILLRDEFGKIIDYSKCKICLKCVENCPVGALVVAGKEMTVHDIVAEVIKDSIFYRKTNGGVTIGGGEPFNNPDFLISLLEELKNNRIHTAIETTGFTPWKNIERSLSNIDLFLYDFKHPLSKIHKQYTGVKNEIILENLKKIDTLGHKIWIRIPVIPGFNDGVDIMFKSFDFIARLKNVEKVELLPYHKLGVSKYMQLGKKYMMQELEAPTQDHLNYLKDNINKKYPNIVVNINN